jgi:hypothetical protein
MTAPDRRAFMAATAASFATPAALGAKECPSARIRSPRLVAQASQKRLEPTRSSSRQSDVLSAMAGPSKKPTTHES